MRGYIVRFVDISNSRIVKIKVMADCSFDAHCKASAVMRRVKTRSYYWLDTYPLEWERRGGK